LTTFTNVKALEGSALRVRGDSFVLIDRSTFGKDDHDDTSSLWSKFRGGYNSGMTLDDEAFSESYATMYDEMIPEKGQITLFNCKSENTVSSIYFAEMLVYTRAQDYYT
jgi:hypothetical protein